MSDTLEAQSRKQVQGWLDDARMIGIVGEVRDKLERRLVAWACRLVGETAAKIDSAVVLDAKVGP